MGYASSHRVHKEFAGGNLFFIKLLTIYCSVIRVSTQPIVCTNGARQKCYPTQSQGVRGYIAVKLLVMSQAKPVAE